jgi:hypothetical protein
MGLIQQHLCPLTNTFETHFLVSACPHDFSMQGANPLSPVTAVRSFEKMSETERKQNHKGGKAPYHVTEYPFDY